MDKYEKKALKVSMFWGTGSSIFAFMAGTGIPSSGYQITHLWTLLQIMVVCNVVWYFYYFKRNINSHRNLIEKFGNEYIEKLENRLQDEGMYPLIWRCWFVKLDKGEIES